MSKAKFRKHLKELNIEELKHELMGLYEQYPEVRKHYAMELGSDKERAKIFQRAKDNIQSKYATKSYRRPRRPRIRKINLLLNSIAQSSIFNHELIDLYFYDVEEALVFIVRYHYYSQTLGNHIRSVFKKAMDLVRHEQMEEDFSERIRLIIDRAIYIPELQLDLKQILNTSD